jgi:hypothetical protein
MNQLRSEIKADLTGMERRLLLEIGHALTVAVEQIGSKAAVVDEEYGPKPARVTSVERELNKHRQDFLLHKRPPRAVPPKASSRGAKGKPPGRGR